VIQTNGSAIGFVANHKIENALFALHDLSKALSLGCFSKQEYFTKLDCQDSIINLVIAKPRLLAS
jgi:hypothetical protein